MFLKIKFDQKYSIKKNDGIIKCDLENMEDFKKCIPYMSEHKLIFKINKIWFMSKNMEFKLNL